MELNTKINNYKFRASSIGNIMINNKQNTGMGETAFNYLKDIHKEIKWNVKKDIKSKYITKGLEVEPISIAFYCVNSNDFLIKNEERRSNDYVTGEPDLLTEDTVIDIKSSWNAFTIPHKTDKINKMYFYQLQTYMWLFDKHNAKLAYILINTPSKLVQDEKRKLAWEMGLIDDIDEDYIKACEEIDRSHNFDHIPVNERIVEFDIKRDDKVIEQIQSRVIEARKYLMIL